MKYEWRRSSHREVWKGKLKYLKEMRRGAIREMQGIDIQKKTLFIHVALMRVGCMREGDWMRRERRRY